MRRNRITVLLALLLAALLLLSGCGNVKEILTETAPEQTEALPLAELTEIPTEAPTDAPTKAAKTKAPKATKAPTEAPTKAAKTKAPKATKAPTDAPTKAAKTKAPKATKAPTDAPTKAEPITDPQEIADYIFAHGKLPDNFITKAEAQALGWDSGRRLDDYAPGKSIGGDRFGSYEGRLPNVKGRRYYEADCNYTGGKRGGERIVYSSDGHVWYTADHYETFTELFPSE